MKRKSIRIRREWIHQKSFSADGEVMLVAYGAEAFAALWQQVGSGRKAGAKPPRLKGKTMLIPEDWISQGAFYPPNVVLLFTNSKEARAGIRERFGVNRTDWVRSSVAVPSKSQPHRQP